MLCKICKTDKDLEKAGGKQFICRSCNTSRVRKYRQTSAGKAAIARANAKYKAKNRERVKAWRVASRAHKIILPCEVCGGDNAHRHHDNIKQETVIRFLCPLHHKQAEKVLLSNH